MVWYVDGVVNIIQENQHLNIKDVQNVDLEGDLALITILLI